MRVSSWLADSRLLATPSHRGERQTDGELPGVPSYKGSKAVMRTLLVALRNPKHPAEASSLNTAPPLAGGLSQRNLEGGAQTLSPQQHMGTSI